MRKFLIYILIINTLCFGCKDYGSKKSSNMREYKCTFEGDKKDIFHFLNSDSLNMKDLKLLKLANHYTFSEGENSIMLYVYDVKSEVLKAFRPKGISTVLKTDRKYKMSIIESVDKTLKMKVISKGESFTQMKSNFIKIDCIEGNVIN